MHDPQSIQLILTAVAAGALVVQTIFMIVLALIALKAIRTVREEMATYRSSVMPIIERTREVVQNVAPKIEQVTIELAAITKSLREQTSDIQIAANDIIDRTQRQASRVDGMLTAVLDRVERVGVTMSEAVAKPMRQISALIASVKAAVETLRDPQSAQAPPPRAVPSRYTDGDAIPGPRAARATTPFRP